MPLNLPTSFRVGDVSGIVGGLSAFFCILLSGGITVLFGKAETLEKVSLVMIRAFQV